jgi:hypothetical protein
MRQCAILCGTTDFRQLIAIEVQKGGAVTSRAKRVLFGLEAALAGSALALAVVTAIWRDWIEIVFGVDPDKHSGSLEWLIVAACLAIAVILGAAARAQWRRLHPRAA